VLGIILEEQFGKGSLTYGHERGYTPNLSTAEEALKLLRDAIRAVGAEGKASIALDAAASSFYDPSTKLYQVDGQLMSERQLSNYYIDLCQKYPEIVSIEDPFYETHFKAHARFTALLAEIFGGRVQTVGDDLYTTNVTQLEKGIRMRATDNVLAKINQIGTVWETIYFVLLARAAGMGGMMSHRSKEPPNEPFIVHLAVGLGLALLKAGATTDERKQKYDELERIVRMNPQLGYAGLDFRSPRPRDSRTPTVDKQFSGAGRFNCESPATPPHKKSRLAAK
jgi:enolase